MAISMKAILNPFRRPVLAVTVLGLLVLVTVGVKARVWRSFRPANNSSQELLPPAAGAVQIVRFTVYDAGIFPREARVSAGLVALYIEDMSGASAGLVVASESLQTVAQVVPRPQRWRGNARVSLAPGRYTVYDASRPINRATLIVEP
jgi:hypothetical protein